MSGISTARSLVQDAGTMRAWYYECSAGIYMADTLLGLLREIFTHRLWHWRRGDGWVD